MRQADVLLDAPSRRQKGMTAARATEEEAFHRQLDRLMLCANSPNIGGGASGTRNTKPTYRNVNTVLKPASSARGRTANDLGPVHRPSIGEEHLQANSGKCNPSGVNGLRIRSTRAGSSAKMAPQGYPSEKVNVMREITLPRRCDETWHRRLRRTLSGVVKGRAISSMRGENISKSYLRGQLQVVF